MKKTLLMFGVLATLSLLSLYFFLPKAFVGNTKGEQSTTTASYACEDGPTLSVSFYADTVHIQRANTVTVVLQHTLSADGGRYSNADESVVFWDKGNSALIQMSGAKDFSHCVKIAADPGGFSQLYADPTAFSVRYPEGYFFPFRDKEGLYERISSTTDYQVNIPTSLAKETNLGSDTHLGIEHIATTKECDASLFLENVKSETITEGDMMYSVASTTDAGAGNRYHEIVYAFPGTNPCRAVRYFIHYSVFENYPKGTIKEFNEVGLIKQFDRIRKTVIFAS